MSNQDAAVTDSPPQTSPVFRIEVWPRPAAWDDAIEPAFHLGPQILRELPGLQTVVGADVYLIAAPLTSAQRDRIASELLADPVSQRAVIGAQPASQSRDVAHAHAAQPVESAGDQSISPHDDAAVVAEAPANVRTIEVHYLPGVMDPVAQSTVAAIAEMLADVDPQQVQVRTARRYDLHFDANTDAGAIPDEQTLRRFAASHLANPVVQAIDLSPRPAEPFPATTPYTLQLTHVPLIELDDQALTLLSRKGHLFLSLEEMKAVQAYFRQRGADPTDIELETIAQTWSEHCVHKTLKATIRYEGADAQRWASRDGHTLQPDGSLVIENLLKSTIAAATFQLMREDDMSRWCVSVFEDNAGIVRFDDELGVCMKVETHNHPSAIEPYGGAATGIGGCIRDILGTGLAAWPIANTDTFCVASPDDAQHDMPAGVIHPRRILERVVDGVRDYGNRMGIPTVNGGVHFHRDYLGNPLVFAGCVGVIPLDMCFGHARPGDAIVVLGGATGRDGIHGATFSSAELTDAHADEFGHAVQIGNPITQKTMMDVIVQARDHDTGCLFHAITDCGAGGLSSAVGEMGEKVGAEVDLENAPLKYQGLSYDEIWISEAQERMVLAVAQDRLAVLRELCEAEDVPMAVLGQFGCVDENQLPTLVLRYEGEEVGRLAMPFLHDGIPTPQRQAVWQVDDTRDEQAAAGAKIDAASPSLAQDAALGQTLHALLGHPNIASKHWIIRQYDHEVQGASSVKPLVGPNQDGPSDAAVVRPRLDSMRGVALSNGLAIGLGEKTPGGDSYLMALAGLDEAVRNAVCVGADPARIAVLDNFCWPSCDNPANLGSLVRAAEACYEGSLAYRTPFISGKDSLNNQFTTDAGRVITIPPTLLISAMGLVADVRRCITMDAKAPGNLLVLVGAQQLGLLGSHYAMLTRPSGDVGRIAPRVDLELGPRTARAVASLITDRLVASAHDCSEGGLLVAAAEMAFAGRLGLELDVEAIAQSHTIAPAASSTGESVDVDLEADADARLRTMLFNEAPSRYLIETTPDDLDALRAALDAMHVPHSVIGRFESHDRLTMGDQLDEPIDQLRQTWQAPLNW